MDRRQFLSSTAAAAWAVRASFVIPQAVRLDTQDPAQATQLPSNLPIPVDDGACRHLLGMTMPGVRLRSTNGRWVDVREAMRARTVFYCYPRTGRPGEELGPAWDEIPGARGCTLETCTFRDHHADLQRLQANVFGVSTQSTAFQREMVQRLRVPFEVLSDDHLRLTTALRLPTFRFDGMTLIKRLTLVVRDRTIEKVFYPVFPPEAHAAEVISWLKSHATT
jgi:peroxiredoxin